MYKKHDICSDKMGVECFLTHFSSLWKKLVRQIERSEEEYEGGANQILPGGCQIGKKNIDLPGGQINDP